MRNTTQRPRTLISVSIYGLLLFCAATAEVVVYPAIAGSPTSPEFSVAADGKVIWVEGNGLEHYAKFACSENTDIVVTSLGSPGSFVVRPEQYVRNVRVEGSVVRFTLIQPRTVFVETDAATLLLIPNQLPPTSGLSKTAARVYGPGTHNVGTLNIGSDAVEIKAGAVLKGRIVGSGGAKIYGGGTIDGTGNTSGGIPVIKLEGGSGGYIDGITVRGADWWAVVPSGINGFTMKNVTITGCAKDGIDPLSCQNFKILNCTVKTPDDAISVKNVETTPTKNLLVEGCTLAGTSFGDGFTIGFETKKGDLGFITVRNCIILSGKGGNKVGGHSGFSIIADGPAPVHDVLFENITVETDVTRNFEIQVTEGNLYPKMGTGTGRVSNVILRKITWKASKPLILKGYNATHLVENVTFENCTVAGKLLRSAADGPFTINQYVKGVKFITGATVAERPLAIAGAQTSLRRTALILPGSLTADSRTMSASSQAYGVSGRMVSYVQSLIAAQPAVYRQK